MDESLKSVFFEVFSNNGRYGWTNDFKKQYLRKINDFETDSNKHIPQTILKEKVENIFEKVILIDSQLNIFAEYQKSFELFSKKQIEMYKIELSEKDINGLDKEQNIPYSFEISEEWNKIGLNKQYDGNSLSRVTYFYSKTAQKAVTVSLAKDEIDISLWNSLNGFARNQSKFENGEMVVLNAKLISPTRMLLKIDLDISQNTMEIACDDYEVDENGKKIQDIQSDADRMKVVLSEINKMPLEQSTIDKIKNKLTNGDGIFTKTLLDKINNFEDSNIVIIPTIKTFSREDMVSPELSEKLTTNLFRQKPDEIEKKVYSYYQTHNSLVGFFQQNNIHNTKNAKYANELENDLEAERNSFHAYCFIVKDGKADYLSVDFDCTRNEMSTRSNSYSGKTYETIISKIQQLSC